MKHAISGNKRIIAVVDRHIADLLDEEWKSVNLKKF